MYGEVPIASAVPPVIATGTAIVLPATGMNTAVSIAGTIGAGLATWAIVYLYMLKIKPSGE